MTTGIRMDHGMRTPVMLAALLVACMLWSPLASAQAPAPRPDAVGAVTENTPAGGAVGQGMSIREVLRNGGWLMYVLAGMSFLTVAFVIFFFVVLRPGQVAPPVLHRELSDKIKAGALDDARRAAEYRPCPLSAVTLAAMNYVRTMPNVDPVLLKDIVEGEGARQAEAIQGQTQYLLDIAVVSPMIGLLGTVFGMLKAFGSVAHDIASAKPVVLAAGVSQALITTAFGLIVGIPAMIFYAYFRRRASKLVSHLESSATEILTALLGGR